MCTVIVPRDDITRIRPRIYIIIAQANGVIESNGVCTIHLVFVMYLYKATNVSVQL